MSLRFRDPVLNANKFDSFAQLRAYRLTLIGREMSVALTLHMQIRTGSLKLGLAADDGGVDAVSSRNAPWSKYSTPSLYSCNSVKVLCTDLHPESI